MYIVRTKSEHRRVYAAAVSGAVTSREEDAKRFPTRDVADSAAWLLSVGTGAEWEVHSVQDS